MQGISQWNPPQRDTNLPLLQRAHHRLDHAIDTVKRMPPVACPQARSLWDYATFSAFSTFSFRRACFTTSIISVT
jgi:hypothetical protein